jgi:hypothetical protein
MPQKAQVTSVEAIEAFRANLIVYVSKARPTLEEVGADVLRTKSWIENDQRSYWENMVKRRTRDLQEAQQALFSARISNLRKESAAEQMAYHRARRALDEAETRLRALKKWGREFDGHVAPLLKQTEKLHTVLANDMVKAAAYLAETIKTLAAYAERSPAGVATGSSGSGQPVESPAGQTQPGGHGQEEAK